MPSAILPLSVTELTRESRRSPRFSHDPSFMVTPRIAYFNWSFQVADTSISHFSVGRSVHPSVRLSIQCVFRGAAPAKVLHWPSSSCITAPAHPSATKVDVYLDFKSRATRLYIPLCRSVGWLVGWSVSRSVPFLLFRRFLGF